MNDSLGDRMKGYEDCNRIKLTRRTPVIMRLDGRAFHTVTRGCDKPFDDKIIDTMQDTGMHVFEKVQGAKIGYIQSDEISILLTDYDTLTTAAWFDNNVQKMCSIAASMASVRFSLAWGKPVEFDARVFNLPKEEVINYFRWRYNDWLRNSIQMFARAHFSQKQLNKKSTADMHEMMHGIGLNWADLEDVYKNGTAILKTDSGVAMLENFNWKLPESLEIVNNIVDPKPLEL